ncbi:ASCH domain-containing protein [Candidatus Aciduliprofundum boonei]|uniref:ASCH domain-containing protein n=1 Tax=Aciduliprofundum boonei (strain DSM 19572 / T469) TaxID=439481 RepID=D3TBT9_ACIB4|nr:ASCH domain-containing protein [Candidatus Aciduliprofundum boonei]ADD08024.1 protein of unknown function DUF437 [Aciduliprofundum boonei T469]HII55107.1 ASCH domain-containing protein [Candidatus Aciduliprofundum boonei]
MTRYLNFSEDFMEKIKRGEKRATLRLGVKDYKVGEEVAIRCGDKIIGKAVIKSVNYKKFKELSQEDIILDGYKKKDELKSALEKFYGKFSEDNIFTQIIFELSEVH